VRSLYETHDNGRKQVREEALVDALLGLIQSDSAVQSFVIIDALDECLLESRERLFDLLLVKIDQYTDNKSNFLFSSRKEPDIEMRLTELHVPVRSVPIPQDRVEIDIRLYVSRVIADSRTMRALPSHIKTEIEDTISVKAQGM